MHTRETSEESPDVLRSLADAVGSLWRPRMLMEGEG
jgi:hypothetical protein